MPLIRAYDGPRMKPIARHPYNREVIVFNRWSIAYAPAFGWRHANAKSDGIRGMMSKDSDTEADEYIYIGVLRHSDGSLEDVFVCRPQGANRPRTGMTLVDGDEYEIENKRIVGSFDAWREDKAALLDAIGRAGLTLIQGEFVRRDGTVSPYYIDGPGVRR